MVSLGSESGLVVSHWDHQDLPEAGSDQSPTRIELGLS